MISFTVSENCPALMGTKSLAPSAKSGKISQPVSSTCVWHPGELSLLARGSGLVTRGGSHRRSIHAV